MVNPLSSPRRRSTLRRDRARPGTARLPAEPLPCDGRAGVCARPPRPPSHLLRQLRLAQLRARILAAADGAAVVSRSARLPPHRGASGRDAVTGQGGRRARLSAPRLFRWVRAALWLGLAAGAASRGGAAWRQGRSEEHTSELKSLIR